MKIDKIAAALACFALLAVPLDAGVAKTKAKPGYYGRYYAQRTAACPVRQLPGGDLVDCHGWRQRNTAVGWDNTCLNLDYLPSQFACSSGRR